MQKSLFIIGFTTDYCRVLLLRRYVHIQFDHALKAAARQLDEERLADGTIYILPTEGQEMFSAVFSSGLELTGTFPTFSGGSGYTGTIDILDYQTLNTIPASDPLEAGVTFDYPTVHAVARVPVSTLFFRYFGVEEINFQIHSDASNEDFIL